MYMAVFQLRVKELEETVEEERNGRLRVSFRDFYFAFNCRAKFISLIPQLNRLFENLQ